MEPSVLSSADQCGGGSPSPGGVAGGVGEKALVLPAGAQVADGHGSVAGGRGAGSEARLKVPTHAGVTTSAGWHTSQAFTSVSFLRRREAVAIISAPHLSHVRIGPASGRTGWRTWDQPALGDGAAQSHSGR